jgi:hypothetical protein
MLELQHAVGNRAVQRLVEDALASASESLTDSARERMENTFGRDFTNVRIHTDSKSMQAAAALGTRGFAFGNDIVLSETPDTDTYEGRKLLAHELTHVVQQENSGSAAVPELGPTPSAAESEAETLAPIAAAGASVEPRVASGVMVVAASRTEAILQAKRANRALFESALIDVAKTVQPGARKTYENRFDHTVRANLVGTLRSSGKFDLEGIDKLVRIAGLLRHHWFTPTQEADWAERLEGSVVRHAFWFDGSKMSWVEE